MLELKVYDNSRHMHLAYIGVGEDCHKRGTGSTMMQMLCYLTGKYGYSIDLDITTKFGMLKNNLIRFYKKFGFVHEGSRISSHYIRECSTS